MAHRPISARDTPGIPTLRESIAAGALTRLAAMRRNCRLFFAFRDNRLPPIPAAGKYHLHRRELSRTETMKYKDGQAAPKDPSIS